MTDEQLKQILQQLGKDAALAAHTLSLASTKQKNTALMQIASSISKQSQEILKANQKDCRLAESKHMTPALLERLLLDNSRIDAMASSLEAIADLPDPIGTVLASWERPNGLHISRVRVPLGVIGVIYESRPNVTADAAALCLKSGNAVILRGGSDSFHSATAIMSCIQAGLTAAGLPNTAVQMVNTTDRQAVVEMLHLDNYIDVIIPRGGLSLITQVTKESRIPVLKHLQGLCHTYIHEAADLDTACSVVLNAKLRRPGICGATETLLIDKKVLSSHLPKILNALQKAGCEIRGDQDVVALAPKIELADESDWDTEYLDAIIAIKTVTNIQEAIQHINTHGSQHTDAIITTDNAAAETFLNEVESAIVMHNTSTQFADGGEFGMGAEIGIATGKLHARGPVGVEQLTTFKYLVRGDGQVRA